MIIGLRYGQAFSRMILIWLMKPDLNILYTYHESLLPNILGIFGGRSYFPNPQRHAQNTLHTRGAVAANGDRPSCRRVFPPGGRFVERSVAGTLQADPGTGRGLVGRVWIQVWPGVFFGRSDVSNAGRLDTRQGDRPNRTRHRTLGPIHRVRSFRSASGNHSPHLRRPKLCPKCPAASAALIPTGSTSQALGGVCATLGRPGEARESFGTKNCATSVIPEKHHRGSGLHQFLDMDLFSLKSWKWSSPPARHAVCLPHA